MVVISCLFFLVNWVCLLIQSPNNFLTNSIVYEFSLGMICYLIYRYVKLNRATGVIFCILAMVWIAVLYFLEWHGYEEKLIEYRWFILGMPSSLLLLGLINLPPALINNGIYRIGEGSYSIYLTHFTISLPFVGILSRVGQYVFAPYSLSIYWAWPLIGICVVLSCGIGLLFHRYIELRFARKNIFSM